MFLDDWQAWVLDEACAEDERGRWCASTVGLIVPRQNGKNEILVAHQLACLFLWGVELIVHSAHKFDTAQEHYRRLREVIQGSEMLMDLMPATRNQGFTEANGKEQIETRAGNRIKFAARSRGAGRGFSGNVMVFDEAMDLADQSLGAMIPALSAKTMADDDAGVQIWLPSSAPHSGSLVLHALRERGHKADPSDRLFYAEWGNEPGTDLDDPDALAAANPALNVRISEQFVRETEQPLLAKSNEFGRERLGIPDAPDMGTSPFPPGTWEACCDPHPADTSAVPTIAIDVHPDLASASIAGARALADSLTEVALIDWRQGTHWLVPATIETCTKHGVPVVVDPRSAAGGFIDDLEKAGVTVVQIKTADLLAACVKFQRAVVDGTLRHRGQFELDAAVHGAAVRTVGEGWAWARLTSKVDISPLVAATLALGGIDKNEPAPGMAGEVDDDEYARVLAELEAETLADLD